MSEKHQHRLSILLFYGLILVLAFLAFRMIKPFLMTLAWACILSMAASPIFNRLRRRRWPPGRAALAATLTTTLLVVVPAIILLVALGREAGQAYTTLQGVIDDARNHPKLLEMVEKVRTRLALPDLAELRPRLASGAEGATRWLAGSVGAILQNAALLIFHLFIALVAMFFFLRDSVALSQFLRRLLPFDETRKDQLIAQARDLVYAGTLTTLAVAGSQGLAGGVVFAVLGLNAPVLWGAVMAVFALIPLIGTAAIWGPTAIWLFATGSWVKGTILAVFGVAVVGTIDNFMRPAMLSGRTEMNGLVALVGIMGGVAAFGFIGIVLGPVIMAMVITLLKLAASDS